MIVRIAVKVKNPPVLPGLNVLCEVMMYPAGVAQVRNLHSEIRTHLVTGVWLLHLHCNNELNILNQSILPVGRITRLLTFVSYNNETIFPDAKYDPKFNIGQKSSTVVPAPPPPPAKSLSGTGLSRSVLVQYRTRRYMENI